MAYGWVEEDWMTIADYYSPKKVSDTLYSHTYVFFSFSAYFDNLVLLLIEYFGKRRVWINNRILGKKIRAGLYHTFCKRQGKGILRHFTIE